MSSASRPAPAAPTTIGIVNGLMRAWRAMAASDPKGCGERYHVARRNSLYALLFAEANDATQDTLPEIPAASCHDCAALQVSSNGRRCSPTSAANAGREMTQAVLTEALRVRQNIAARIAALKSAVAHAGSAADNERAYLALATRIQRPEVCAKLAASRLRIEEFETPALDAVHSRLREQLDAFAARSGHETIATWTLARGSAEEDDIGAFMSGAAALVAQVRRQVESTMRQKGMTPSGAYYEDVARLVRHVGDGRRYSYAELARALQRQAPPDLNLNVEIAWTTVDMQVWRVEARGRDGYVLVLTTPDIDADPRSAPLRPLILDEAPVAVVSTGTRGSYLTFRGLRMLLHELGHAIQHITTPPSQHESDGFDYQPLERLDGISMAIESLAFDSNFRATLQDGRVDSESSLMSLLRLAQLPEQIGNTLVSLAFYRHEVSSWSEAFRAAEDMVGPGVLSMVRASEMVAWPLHRRRPAGEFSILWAEAVAASGGKSHRPQLQDILVVGGQA